MSKEKFERTKPHVNVGTIGHVDHGKSTLVHALTGIDPDRLKEEKERGITIASAATFCQWKKHEINIIDTPGHVDFQYEVSRSLACCEGAMLLVDAFQGVEAQTKAIGHPNPLAATHRVQLAETSQIVKDGQLE